MNFDGSESVPDLNKATFLAFDNNLVPLKDSWIAEWRYPSGVVTRRIANRQGKTNIHIKFGLTPVPAGNACTVCWGNGKAFGPGETPSVITVVIAGVEKGPGWTGGMGEPPNGAFELTQDVSVPCNYTFQDDNFAMLIRLAPFLSIINIVNLPSATTSFFTTGSVCQTFYENTVTDSFVGGTATIFIPPIL